MRTCANWVAMMTLVLLSGLRGGAEAGIIGNTLSSRSSASDGQPTVLWTNAFGAPTSGSADSVEAFFQGSTNTFELFQLRPTGTAQQFDVIARSGTITPSGALNTVQSYPLPNGAFQLLQGDMVAHYGRGLPWTASLATPAAHNNQRIYWPSPSSPSVGNTITLGTGGFPTSSIQRDYAWSVEIDPLFQTVGNGAGWGTSAPDSVASILVVMDNDPFTVNGQLRTWQFFNHSAISGVRNITPALLRDTGGTVEVIGVGTTRVGADTGFQQYDFDLVAGTDLVSVGDLFGFYYGDQSGGNAGSVQYSAMGSLNVRLFADANGINLGDLYTTPAHTLNRYYAANATVVYPEPTSLVLIGMGLGVLARRRRRRGKGNGTALVALALAVVLALGSGSASANAITVGQDLDNRSSLDGSTGNLFAAEVFGFREGTADQWSIRSTAGAYAGTRNITPVVLEQTGSGGLGSFTLLGIGTTRSISHTAAVQSFDFGLTSGTDRMGPRRYFGWIDSDAGAAANAGTISYDTGGSTDHFTLYRSNPGALAVGNTYGVTSNLQRRYSLQVDVDTGGAEAVGNGASQRANTDGATGAVFVLDDPFTRTNYVSEWAFWSWSPGNRQITPLIFEEVAGNYLLRGVGTSRLVPAQQGTITYDFGLQSGSAVVDASYYFGWVDALIDYANGSAAGNQGVVRWADDEFFSAEVRWFGTGGTFLPGTDFGAGSHLVRAYSIQAIAVPEPGTLSLLGLGGLALLRRRRRK